MQTKVPNRHKAPAHDDRRIEGPITEYNRYDQPTGATYFRCTRCGAEAMHPRYLQGCCNDC